MSNYQHASLSPPRRLRDQTEVEEELIDEENKKFQVQRPELLSQDGDRPSKMQQGEKSAAAAKGLSLKSDADYHSIVSQERPGSALTIGSGLFHVEQDRTKQMHRVMNELDKKVISLERQQAEKKAQDDFGTVGAQILAGSSRNTTQKGNQDSISNIRRNQQAAFRSVPRERTTEKLMNTKVDVPPVGAYRARYLHIDPKVASPKFGTEKTWGGQMANQSQ